MRQGLEAARSARKQKAEDAAAKKQRDACLMEQAAKALAASGPQRAMKRPAAAAQKDSQRQNFLD